MSISFTASRISRLKRDITEIQNQINNDKIKAGKALSKIKQLQKELRMNPSSPDSSSKSKQIKKLNEEIVKLTASQEEFSKQLSAKNAELRQQLAKDQKKD
ncbi:hypothetical protein [Paenibacillus gorillae]|uniref:hypothetical protein n=1 Tax=Paenibacillus gorillae TaxID=1243662 RepID=UPI0004B8C5C6|nr:hypothetical protein [Paenibacillus gorillae]